MKLINIESSATVTPASLLAFCDQTSTVLDLYTGSYWNYDTSKSEWYVDIGGAAKYDATVCTSADLQAALESNSIQSIYVRLTRENANIVLGSGTADQTITLGTSKNLFGQPFTVGSSTSYVTTLALGANNFRARNDRIDVGGKLTFTGTGTAYIKKLSPSGASNLVVGVSGKLLIENLRTPAAVSNATINMWDMPLRMGSSSSVGNQQVLRYDATTGEWAPITLTGPTDYPLIKGVDSMLLASAASSVALNRNSGQYVVHLTKITPNGDVNLNVNSKIQYYVTQASANPTISWCIVLYEDVTDYSAGTVVPTLALRAYSNMSTSTISASTDYVENTLSNLASGVTGLSASKPYYIGLFWKSSSDFCLLGVSGSNLSPTYKTRGPALWVDNLGASLSAPPNTIVNTSTQINEATGRHFFRIYNP